MLFLVHALLRETIKHFWWRKNMSFDSFNAQWWRLVENVVYCNILPSIKAAILQVEKTLSTVATLVLMFTIRTSCPSIWIKQLNQFHAKCNLKVNYERKCLGQPKGIVWMLQIQIIVGHGCHKVDIFLPISWMFFMTILFLTSLIS